MVMCDQSDLEAFVEGFGAEVLRSLLNSILKAMGITNSGRGRGHTAWYAVGNLKATRVRSFLNFLEDFPVHGLNIFQLAEFLEEPTRTNFLKPVSALKVSES